MGSYLLVGGSSDIGLHLSKMLIEGGNKVTLLVRDESRLVELPKDSVQIFVENANDGLVTEGYIPVLFIKRKWN